MAKLTFPASGDFQPKAIFTKSKASRLSTASYGHWAQLQLNPDKIIPLLVFKIDDYKKNVIDGINFKFKSHPELKNYLISIVEYASGNLKVSKQDIKTKFKLASGAYSDATPSKMITKIEPNFGEILAPIFATRWVKPFIDRPNVKASGNNLTAAYGSQGARLKYIIFPDVQNYPLFDFFISDDYIFGFSVKGAGTSNPLAVKEYEARLSQEWIEKIAESSPNFAGKFKNEIELMRMLGKEKKAGGSSMVDGPIRALGRNLKMFNNVRSPLRTAEYKKSLSETFTNINLEHVADVMDSAGMKKSFMALSGLSEKEKTACLNFLLYFSLGRSNKSSEIEKWKKNPKKFIVAHFVSGCIQYMCDLSFPKLTELTRLMFPDLNIVKVDLREGIPQFTLQEHRNIGQKLAEATYGDVNEAKRGSDYAFRSKASFGRVKDKLGVQL